MAKNEMTCETSLIGAAKTRDSSGSMGSQMRCTDMLENVAKDNKKIARRVLGVNAWDGGCEWDFKASRLYYAGVY
ncbi:hypothetical protein LINBF2_11400 [Limnohabitans sp. INBF002]|nr:hypothetical protein LINBF2_11400 [Limnohabitans sp. INBF002]